MLQDNSKFLYNAVYYSVCLALLNKAISSYLRSEKWYFKLFLHILLLICYHEFFLVLTVFRCDDTPP